MKGGKSIISLSENDLLKSFEDLQQKLVELYRTEGSFLSPTVLQISQQLDEYIVAIQKMAKNLNECRD
ncbi:aspartyl-phosphate phosphatase Spo0E family protein [Brevibacillus laterosporus]|uniref:aspartyl-phosphate phosphatase Spo0E family protein n=1 Tax=Brevibacillus laterosporus TaxID=1465 RepID=UPI002E1F80F3